MIEFETPVANVQKPKSKTPFIPAADLKNLRHVLIADNESVCYVSSCPFTSV